MDRSILGKKIRAERKRLGLSQEQVAEMINVSTSYIGLVERGERSVTLEKLISLANCFHVSLDSLLQDNISVPQSFQDEQIYKLWNQASEREKNLILSIVHSILDFSKKK